MLVRPCAQEDGRGMSCWQHPRESGPELIQGPGGVTTSPTLLGPVLLWSQQNYLRLLLTVRYFESSYSCCLRDPSLRKSGHEGELIFFVQTHFK